MKGVIDCIGVFFMPAFFLLFGLVWPAKPQIFVPFVRHKPLISLMMLSGAGTLVRGFLTPRIGLMGYVTVVFVVASVVSLGITGLLVRVAPWTLGMKRRAA